MPSANQGMPEAPRSGWGHGPDLRALRGAQPCSPVDTVIGDVRPPELCENEFLCLSHLVWGALLHQPSELIHQGKQSDLKGGDPGVFQIGPLSSVTQEKR